MKRIFKAIVVAILARQIRQLRNKHQFKVIGVVGGAGKTSTKLAIAQLLGTAMRVRYETLQGGYQESNYNDIVSVPLVFFGHRLPSLFNPFAWMRLFISNAKQIRGDYPFDVVVIELGTNRPGHIAAFQKYGQLDCAVVTSIVPEHMQYFKDMKAVAEEELSVAAYAKKIVYCADFVPGDYRSMIKGAVSYGMVQPVDYRLTNVNRSARGAEGDVVYAGKQLARFTHDVISDIQLYPVIAAVAVGHIAGLSQNSILKGIAAVAPVSGRMRRLNGIRGSTIIDDTYNALPDAVKIGLDAVYAIKASQKIAILGNMNELGDMSAQAHRDIGALCDPSQLDFVATIGPDANAYLAPAAAANGCLVKTFNTPYEAGNYLKTIIKPGALIYAKGSQNKVFAEEAVKLLLLDPDDASKIVRQSPYWLKRKRESFGA